MTEQSPAEAIFFAALEHAKAEERAAYLDAACGDDGTLRRRVERLLAAHPQVGSFLEAPAQAEVASHEATTIPPAEQCPAAPGLAGTGAYREPSETVGAVIAGRYKLVEKIGEGGMGTVWVAQQTEPVKRVVAVKLIKAGMDSKAVLARFDAERQALALMDHPNIARVLDGGATLDGRPFFVMELVKGVPITQFCDARRLTPRQRLELFVPVCQAIQHAHQKGVIHRDIKPSNVLIALYDDKPVPKVIDFGVAKATGQTLTDKSLMTGFGAVVGTPEYMSPEQASLNNLDIDTRSDVYSLGVLLYELLAGSPPFRSEELQKAGLIEMLRLVCEEEPPRPSIKLSTANKRASISADRGTEPKKLTGLLRNELDWIVMKALEKDRARRYETVNGLAADVQRYLAGEAVQAHPPSAAYRLRKFVRKHRAGLITAASFLSLLIVAAVVSVWLAVKARHAEALADERRTEADANAVEAKEIAKLYEKVATDNANARLEAEITATSLQIDLDLSELRTDPRVGLLRLVRPRKQLFQSRSGQRDHVGSELRNITEQYPHLTFDNESGDYKALRELATLAVLATGQRFTNLVPPIELDGSQVVNSFLDSSARRILTLEKDGTARLWDARTGRPIAVLRRGNERVLSYGLSSDETTVHTDSSDGVVRLWDVNDGVFRAETAPRPDRIRSSGALSAERFCGSIPTYVSRDRVLTLAVTVNPKQPKKEENEVTRRVPVELWDARNGKFVARLNRPELNPNHVQFIADDKYVATVEGKSTIAILSAEDGRLLESFSHPVGESVSAFYVSPNGRRIVTHCEIGKSKPHYRVWERETEWRSLEVLATEDAVIAWFLSDDVVLLSPGVGRGRILVFSKDGSRPKIVSTPEPSNETNLAFQSYPRYEVTGNYLRSNCRLIDLRTGNLLRPPNGRRYHPDLAGFAPDGRFVVGGTPLAINGVSYNSLVDTRTEKVLELDFGGNAVYAPLLVNSPKNQWIIPASQDNIPVLKMLPPTGAAIPPDLLELWAQVVVRGELGAGGEFVKWDQGTWEKKRQELAAKPAPLPDFPFPGYVARDQLHWLRQEYENSSDADKPRWAKQLLDRAEVIGDKAEAVRWRAVLAADAKRPPQPPAK